MPPRIPLSSGGPGPLGLVALALAILAAGLLLEGHPVDASVAPRPGQPEIAAPPGPSQESMLQDLIGRD
ncbi:hypothetical protein [Methylobacterium indicum]|uniref:Uncharacterized protein n=1 Tax=Methylobacterium indicum TaxID=1775910 RepID=A0A0J6RIN6_9HYPH|nr:hypothetical protein [Methylobacterium indicum]KMO21174.1 hypothetical protein QR78_09170 [Methylobacterium indicum]KMO26219.1 hypothetical protein QR79_03595 [Methylobacterium indicum]BCM82829.1 hypothetical protein mvi_12900 [Methylobacterium indicum]